MVRDVASVLLKASGAARSRPRGSDHLGRRVACGPPRRMGSSRPQPLGTPPGGVGITSVVGGVRPSLASVPPPSSMPADLEVRQALDSEVRTLVQKGAVEGVRYASFPGFYDLLFTFLKASGGQRPVLALFTSQGFPSESLASGWRRCRTFGQRFVLGTGGPPST